ncbi:MAG: 30S ribosomal protein S12 methylthiotransferase RimO [Pseudomonadota bacterium]
MNKSIYFSSLGCPKNLVDSEVMLGRLVSAGWNVVPNQTDADCIVVNTCGFIESAVEEGIDNILELAQEKEKGRCRRLIVAGCLPQRYGEALLQELPEVDLFLGTGAFNEIVPAVEGTLGANKIFLPLPENASSTLPLWKARIRSTPGYTAYLKVAEGCSNRCSYCIIPQLRGALRSRPIDEILEEARFLADNGVRELILVAQETTCYGVDLYGKSRLSLLLAELAKIPEFFWIRFLYCHPDRVDEELVERVAMCETLCNYFDIPIQHISEPILKRMGRPSNAKKILGLFRDIRNKIPDAALRTTLMVGFPGETEEDFNKLLNMLEEAQFDHVGVFPYSNENDLPSCRLRKHISEEVKEERRSIVMSMQARISKQKNQKRVGKTYKAVIEGYSEETDLLLKARTYFQAPDIDGLTYISQGKADIGQWVDVLITEAHEYDLIGEIL